ncbi:hypothetical protein [Stigmatella aurantiaca]|uniref:Conserved uncharacterized protein n=1 Tax=Stigmatella aurantiaca (strain DW4/3-1) TaxID=378806 RepID=Q08ZE8_STIAD|nr:hypothetical protein [Stigmatella aurantiaca]ADO75331.1 conserved uncharacterized protein [Stigmatella aurantiaca DW4/3-1]EAU65850.1 hypothetical protein STIAU_5697 [Stigmatella aurantiaca DW4/3-1]
MFHLLKLGPVPLSQAQGSTNVYLRISASGEFASPVFEQDDAVGVQALLLGVEASEVCCEPALADVAQSLGLRVEPPPEQALTARAAIATFMAWEQRGVAALGADKALLFVQAATEFWEAQPWTHWDDSQPFAITLSGAHSHTYEGSVFGGGDEGGEGIALYEQSGALQVLMELQGQGKGRAATALPAIAVTLDHRPSYAVEALAAAHRAPRLPLPLKTGPSGLSVPSPMEAVVLVATLRAMARLTPSHREVLSTLVAGSEQLAVRVIAPAPRIRN